MVAMDLDPEQRPINRERIMEMITWRPRRMQLANEWKEPIHPPSSKDGDWSLVLPFCETFRNAFNCMCRVKSIGLREGKEGRCYTFLKDVKGNENALPRVKKWVETIGRYVCLRDCLALSFALDYDRKCGNPQEPQTDIGLLRSRAKPYDAAPTQDTYLAAEDLATDCLDFLEKVNCYDLSDTVVAMPPSKPDRAFNLPSYLAKRIATARAIKDLSKAVRTVRKRSPIKNSALADKLGALEDTIEVDKDLFQGRIVLLVDDLYQSGISMNYVAMLLLEAGTSKVFGLACEKTCSNDDNLSKSGK